LDVAIAINIVFLGWVFGFAGKVKIVRLENNKQQY
jgi:hypothetical protein